MKCSYCDEGYFKDLTQEEIQNGKIPNDVKCDHCKGSGICSCDKCVLDNEE